jgi:hypothetical protein
MGWRRGCVLAGCALTRYDGHVLKQLSIFPLLFLITGCAVADPVPVTSAVPTVVAAASPQGVTCADLDAAWGDWPTTISVLETLIAAEQSCGPEPLTSKLYAAHFNYGEALEGQGDAASAVTHYTTAFNLNPRREESLRALYRLNALPSPTPATCDPALTPNPDPAPADPPDAALLLRAEGTQLLLGDVPFTMRGVNYYPRHAPWDRFLAEGDLTEIAAEFELLQQAGFNTIRIFLWYDALFQCAPEAAIPNEAAFAKLDAILHLAEVHGLKVLMTLNDLPDLYLRPLYTDWARSDAQTVYIVRRYRNDTTVVMWDLRNEGDLDYGARGDAARFTQQEVIDWLAHTSALVRENDPNHLITAGWWGDPTETAPYVDVLSFHHWSTSIQLNVRIDSYEQPGKPLLLEEVGYHSWTDAPIGAQSPDQQAQMLADAIKEADAQQLAGWLIWTAFDFEPMPGQPVNFEHFFGLWTVDLVPKPGLDAATGGIP